MSGELLIFGTNQQFATDTFEAFLTYRASENGYSKADVKLGSIEDPRDPGQ